MSATVQRCNCATACSCYTNFAPLAPTHITCLVCENRTYLIWKQQEFSMCLPSNVVESSPTNMKSGMKPDNLTVCCICACLHRPRIFCKLKLCFNVCLTNPQEGQDEETATLGLGSSSNAFQSTSIFASRNQVYAGAKVQKQLVQAITETRGLSNITQRTQVCWTASSQFPNMFCNSKPGCRKLCKLPKLPASRHMSVSSSWCSFPALHQRPPSGFRGFPGLKSSAYDYRQCHGIHKTDLRKLEKQTNTK